MPCNICKKNGHNRRSCKSGAPNTTEQIQEGNLERPIESSSVPEPQPLDEKYWVCPLCGLSLGNDHRMCLFEGYNCDVAAWEKGCQETGRLILERAKTNPQ